MITPADIENKEFSRAVRGYKEDEVNEFINVRNELKKYVKQYENKK